LLLRNLKPRNYLLQSRKRTNDSPSRSLRSSASSAATASSAAALSVISRAEFAAESTSTAASSAAIVSSALLEPFWNFLLRFDEQFEQIADDVRVLVVEEARGETDVADATGSADSVDVLVDIAWKVEVDHVTHVGNVETSSGDLKTIINDCFICQLLTAVATRTGVVASRKLLRAPSRSRWFLSP
jgi:hypothetical protein